MDKILTKQQAAEVLQTNERFIGDSIKEGKLKAHKVGKRIYILYSDLIAFIKDHPYEGGQD